VALLLQWRRGKALSYGAAVALPLLVVQGGIDLFLWGRPFAELTEYVGYNLVHTTTYFDQPWYNYLLLLLGIYIPFFSVAVCFGFFRRTSPLLLWLPVLLFLAIHSYFPNKQERFLLPIVPLFFVLGYVAWEQWRMASSWWHRRQGLWKGLLRFTWALNTVLLVVLCFSYSKRSRVEALYMLHGAHDVRGLVIEDSAEGSAPMPPLFYGAQWRATVVPWTDPTEDLSASLGRFPEHVRPNVVLFFGEDDMEERVARVEEAMGALREVGRAEPGLVDRVVHWLNPVNRNETIVVMQVADAV
jgi:hypothetical protein